MLSPFALRLLLIGIYVTLCCVSPSIGQGPGGYLNTGPPINPNERPLRFKLFSPDTRFHIRNIGAAAPWVLGNENLIGDKWIRTSDKDRRKYGGGYTGNPLSQGLGLFGLPKRTPGLTGLGYTQKGYDDGSGPDDSYIGPGGKIGKLINQHSSFNEFLSVWINLFFRFACHQWIHEGIITVAAGSAPRKKGHLRGLSRLQDSILNTWPVK